MKRLVLAAALVFVVLPAPPTPAARRPTTAEARAIRAAALRTLSGSGWRVSHIRVSTARTVNRYASAAVDNRTTGVGGEMLLATRRGRWTRRFLGTNDFCQARAPRAVLADLFGCAYASGG